MNECAFNNGKKCRILTKKSCSKCNFRKTEEEVRQTHNNAALRLNSLPVQIKDSIREKYGGESFKYAKDVNNGR